MIYVIAAIGVLTCAGSLVGLAAPSVLASTASRVTASRPWRRSAIAARIAFGAIAIIAADDTLYPLAMKIIGVIAIMAGTIMAFVDKETLSRWIAMMSEGGTGIRAMSLAGLALGAFLIHASLA